jgi:hypothetical protein
MLKAKFWLNFTNLVFLKFIIAASMFFSCSKSKLPFIYEAYACSRVVLVKYFRMN